MKRFIENHFGFVLLLSCAAGLVLPGLENVPDVSASVALAMLTYASCFKLRDSAFSDISWRKIAVFYVLRYMVLPVALLALSHYLVPHYAMGVFLLALVPTAVSSPAFSHMFGGRVGESFAIVIVSTLLAPLLIPAMFYLLGEQGITPSPFPLFRTLAFCIFTPMVIYAATRNFKGWGAMMYANVKIISIVLVAFVIALVIAKQRAVILSDIPALFIPFACLVVCYAVFIATGFFLARREPREVQISYATCSGFNNVALGVSLALLHFPAPVILFVAVSEVAWSMVPMAMKTALRLRFPR